MTIGALLLTIMVHEILPPVARREGEGCWPVRVVLARSVPDLMVRVQVKDGDRVLAVRSAKVRYDEAAVGVPCVSDALRLTYTLEFFAKGRAVPHTFGNVPPLPPADVDVFAHMCDVSLLRNPVTPLAPAGEVIASHDGKTRRMPRETAAQIIRLLNDPRSFACAGALCTTMDGTSLRVGTMELGVSLGCRNLHRKNGEMLHLTPAADAELVAIFDRLFRVP